VIAMPIFVQWKWDEKHEDFIVVFHFDDDYSKKNLRAQRMSFLNGAPAPGAIWYSPAPLSASKKGNPQSKIRTVTTWSPSHVELALLTEILTYANIINGFKRDIRRELRDKLEITSYFKGWDLWIHTMAQLKKELGSWESASKHFDKCVGEGIRKSLEESTKDYFDIRQRLGNRTILFSSFVLGSPIEKAHVTRFMCLEICPEYIDYLKEILKPYMK
jgi:hypothetical protein